MANVSNNSTQAVAGILVGVLLVCAVGCGPKDYKTDADERVYRIIDSKWDPQFGPQANYRVSDVEPSPGDIRVPATIPASGVLSLSEAVAIATAHNREYQNQKDLLYTTALDQRLVQHNFQTQFFGGGSLFYVNEDGDERDEFIQAEANFGFNRLLAIGTRISTQLGFAWLDVISGRGSDGLGAVFSGTITQPLLRGRDPEIVLEALTQAQRDTLYQIRRFNRFRKTFVVSVVTQYYQAVEQYALARNADDQYAALVALHEKVSTLATAGRLPKTEADRLQQEILLARDDALAAHRRYEETIDLLKITLGLPMATKFEVDQAALDALRQGGLPAPVVVESDAVQAGLQRRLDMANMADAVMDAERKVRVAADGLRTELNLVATGRAQSNRSSTDSLAAGATVDLPFDRVAEQAVFRKAMLSFEQSRRDYDLAADTVGLEVRKAYRTLMESAQRFLLASEGVKLARTRLENTTALMEYGKASSRRVLDAQQAYYAASDAATSTLIEHAVATLEFYRDTGILQVRPDGMWETPGTLALDRTIDQ